MPPSAASSDKQTIHGTAHVHGEASGRLLLTDTELSFWGGINPLTSEVIDRSHPLSGQQIKDTILAIPCSRGSCSGSATILELILNGRAPRALLFERPDQIITLGVIVAEEVFGKSIPVVLLGEDGFERLKLWTEETVFINGGEVSTSPPDTSEPDLKKSDTTLSTEDRITLEGVNGEAVRIALKIIIRIADMMGASELMDVTQAHVDGAFFGPGSVAFAKRLYDLGARFRVPTTINALTIDLKRRRAFGVDGEYGEQCNELAQLFLGMGATTSFTCAPYLLESAPRMGEAVAWGESNAVAYANSVLGARTLKNANMMECLMAITGRAPKVGLHLSENRKASIHIHVEPFEEVDESFWPLLGYSIGHLAGSRIPAVTGVEHLNPSLDDLKAFSAAFGTSSSAPMFHLVGITPEAKTLESVWCQRPLAKQLTIDCRELVRCWKALNGSVSGQIDLISLGSPHLSCKEIRKLAQLCQGRTKDPDIDIIVTCGRSQYNLAEQAGAVEDLERFSVNFLTDTCWCFIEEPVISKTTKVIMTNSAKYAHYGPGLTGRQFRFGSMEQCVEVACSGRGAGSIPQWLQGA